jgi:hypothetical protein
MYQTLLKMPRPDLKVVYYINMPEIFNSSQASKDKSVNKNSSNPANSKKKTQEKKSIHRDIDEYSEIMKHEKPVNGCLGAFLPKPFKIGFDSQMTDEKIILALRQHPVILVKKIIIIIFAILFPLFFSSFPFTDFFPQSYQIAMTLAWYTLILGFALETFLVWFFSVFLITDERIIDVDFLSLLFKDISSAKIDSIEDISSKTGGMMATVVDYGTVYIQTAGEKTELQFENIPQPAKVAAVLNELMIEEEREKIEGRVR